MANHTGKRVTSLTQPGLPRWMQGDWAAEAPLTGGVRPLALDVAQAVAKADPAAEPSHSVRAAPSPVRRKPLTLLAAILLALVSSLTVAARGLAIPEAGLSVRLPPAIPEDGVEADSLGSAPTELSPEDAAELRALISEQLAAGNHTGPTPPGIAFTGATALDRERAQQCMADAIYYEAGLEPEAGKRAVAQVIL
ncbi:MAG: hypothetical protein LC634_07375, partial [Sphingomonadales bacterium]|nr:hypothetical protein [Sphingomonadales bacterium]